MRKGLLPILLTALLALCSTCVPQDAHAAACTGSGLNIVDGTGTVQCYGITQDSSSRFYSNTAIVDGGNAANKATVTGTGAVKVDNSAVTQPTNLQSISGASLTLGQKAMAASLPVAIASDQGSLNVVCTSGCTGGSGGGGTAQADASTFTQGTTQLTPIGGYYSTAITNLTSGQAGAARLTADRNLMMDLNEVGGAALALGQGTMAASLPVAIASNQGALTVSGTVTANAGTGTLNVNCTSGCSGSPGFADEGAFTQGTTVLTPIGGLYTTAPVALTSGQGGVARLTSDRMLMGDLEKVGGTALALGQATMAGSLPVAIASNQGALAVSESGAPWTVTGTGTAGAAATGVLTVQGIASMTALKVDGSAVTQPVSGTVTANAGSGTFASKDAADMTGTTPGTAPGNTGVVGGIYNTVLPAPSTGQTLPLQLSASGRLIVDGSGVTQPVSGTVTASQGGAPWTVTGTGSAGSAASGVLTVQGIASMTPLKVDGSGVTQPVSGTVTANAGTGTMTIAGAVTQSGTWTVQPGNTANTTPWLTKPGDGTNTITMKASGTDSATTDTALVVAQSPNPAEQCPSTKAISQTASTDLLTATNKIHICAVVLVSASAQSVSLVYGTGTTCGTGTTALIGGTSASLALAANGGFSAVNNQPWLLVNATAQHLCLLQSGSGNLSGTITYADHS